MNVINRYKDARTMKLIPCINFGRLCMFQSFLRKASGEQPVCCFTK